MNKKYWRDKAYKQARKNYNDKPPSPLWVKILYILAILSFCGLATYNFLYT